MTSPIPSQGLLIRDDNVDFQDRRTEQLPTGKEFKKKKKRRGNGTELATPYDTLERALRDNAFGILKGTSQRARRKPTWRKGTEAEIIKLVQTCKDTEQKVQERNDWKLSADGMFSVMS